jgi:hypothetical protein
LFESRQCLFGRDVSLPNNSRWSGPFYEKESCVTPNPFAPPKAEVADIVGERIAPLLWNPNAAANWSLLFSPAFGAFLHMKNWQALGQPNKAASAKVWFVLSLVVLGGLSCASVVGPSSGQQAGFVRLVGFLLLVAWYFGSARGQAAYVKTHFGTNYPRRAWSKPLAGAVLAFLALVVVLTVLAVVLKSAT